MELFELKADIRETTGKGPARALRREGKIPAILYGPETESKMLSVGVRELENILKKSRLTQILVNLVVRNGDETTHPAMLQDLQTHPLSQHFIHADFYHISKDRKITAKVPVATKGKSIGVEMGGMLQIIRRELEIVCYPQDIPEAIEIDVTELDVGGAIHINEIPLTEGTEIASDVNFTVVTVLAPKGSGEADEGEEEGEGEEETAEEEASKAE